MKKRRFLIISMISILSIALALVTLLVPMVHIVGHAADAEKTVVYDSVVSLLQYEKDLPFLYTAATETYFEATGPMWLAVVGILLNYLVIAGAVVLLFVSLTEFVLVGKKDVAIKNNNLTKKIALFVGYFTAFVAVFEITAFIVTSMLSGGYGEFYPELQNYIVASIAVLIIVFAHLIGKKEYDQPENKAKNAVGFGLTAILSGACILFPFLPVYTELMIFNGGSIYYLTSITNLLAGSLSVGVDYPLGMTFYAIFAMILVAAFVFVYSLVGFIMTLCNKKTNWLSARIKRWSMALLIVYTIMLLLVVGTIAGMISSIHLDEFFVCTPLIFLGIFIPFLPYVTSCMVSFSKTKKHD